MTPAGPPGPPAPAAQEPPAQAAPEAKPASPWATRRRLRVLLFLLPLSAFFFLVPTRVDRSPGAVRLTLDDAGGIPAVFVTYRVGVTYLGHPSTTVVRHTPRLEVLAVPGGGTFSPSTAMVVSLTDAQVAEVRERLAEQLESLPWLTAPHTEVKWTGVAFDALVLLLTLLVTLLWHGRLLAWRPAPSWPLALLRVLVFAIWPTYLAQNALRLVDPRVYESLAGSAVTVTRKTGLATLGFLSVLFVLWQTGGRLVARQGGKDDNAGPERPWR